VPNDAFYIFGLKEAERMRKAKRKQLPTKESQKSQSLPVTAETTNQEAPQSKNAPYNVFSAALIGYTGS
jgi:hypothetical protein